MTQIVERLIGRHACQTQADVPIAGARRHIDHLWRRQRQHRQVRERVDVYHGLFPMFAQDPGSPWIAPLLSHSAYVPVLTWCTFLPGE
jgi:hypothetical protein